MAVSSINFQKSSEHSYKHNFRTDSPNYLLKKEDRLENSYWENKLSAKEIFENELSKANRRGGRIPKFENSHWEAVLNLNKEHTLDDVKKVADYLENKLNITCATIAVHRDEGHYKGDKACYNFHAHLTFVTYKNGQQNWRKERIKPQTLSEIQTEVAKILKMDRGQENSEKTRLSAKQYKKVAQELEAKDQEIQETTNIADDCIQELKEELEQEKLSKAKLKAELEQLRQNSKNQGYSKEYFREISKEKKLLRFKTLDEFNEWVKELRKKHTTNGIFGNKVNEEAVLKDMYKVYQEQDNTIQAQNAKIKDLEAEKEQFNELLKTNPALREAYNQALKTLQKLNKKQKQEISTKPKSNFELKLNKIEAKEVEILDFANLKSLNDDVSENTDKIEVKEQDQTHNEDDLGIDKIFQPRKNK